MFCSKCGSELKEGDRFCGNCGAPVNIVTTNVVEERQEETKSQISEQLEIQSQEQLQSQIQPKKQNLLPIIAAVVVFLLLGLFIWLFVRTKNQEKLEGTEPETLIVEQGETNRVEGQEKTEPEGVEKVEPEVEVLPEEVSIYGIWTTEIDLGELVLQEAQLEMETASFPISFQVILREDGTGTFGYVDGSFQKGLHVFMEDVSDYLVDMLCESMGMTREELEQLVLSMGYESIADVLEDSISEEDFAEISDIAEDFSFTYEDGILHINDNGGDMAVSLTEDELVIESITGVSDMDEYETYLYNLLPLTFKKQGEIKAAELHLEDILDMTFADYREAYVWAMESMVNDWEYTTEDTFDLVYLDEDNIPELAWGKNGYYLSVLSFKKDRLYLLLDQQAYGAGGNDGYQYVPFSGIVMNQNADFAGAIEYITITKVGTEPLFSENNTYLASWAVEDENLNGSLDGDEIKKTDKVKEDDPRFYYIYNEDSWLPITEEDFLSYLPKEEMPFIAPTEYSYEDMISFLQ